MMKTYAIILASGTGARSGLNIPKQFYKIKGKTLLEYSVSAFQDNPFVDEIIVVSNPDFIDLTKSVIEKNTFTKITKIVKGGAARQQSSYIGLSQIEDTNSLVLIHDAVRPFVSQRIISDCIEALHTYKAVNTAVESSDTIMQVKNSIIKGVLNRNELVRCQTPQGFHYRIIKQAHELALKNNSQTATDDCGLVLKYNLADVFVVKGAAENIKITYPIDLKIAEQIIS